MEKRNSKIASLSFDSRVSIFEFRVCNFLLADAPGLGKGIEAENNQNHRETCDQNRQGMVPLALRKGNHYRACCRTQEHQSQQYLEKPLSLAKDGRK